MLRYVGLGFWFLVVPALCAHFAVSQVASTPALGPLSTFARGQVVPALIGAFSLVATLLWGVRHRLPLADGASSAASGVPRQARRDFDSAGQLVEEMLRTLSKNEAKVLKHLGEDGIRTIRQSSEQLEHAMKQRPFEALAFREAYRAARKRAEALSPWRKSEFRELVESIGAAVLVALLLRAVLVEAFKIPSGSMRPTLQVGDHIFVGKASYGPTIPFVGQRLFADLPPERGDVIVFEYPDLNPNNERHDFIKRVVAVPGDILEVDDGHPIVNGWRVPSCRVGTHEFSSDGRFPSVGELFVEFLGGEAYLTLYQGPRAPRRQGPYTVAAGEVWVMGDNRHNSMDSREWRRPSGGKGAGVPYANIKGRALIIWLPVSRMLTLVMGDPVLPNGMPEQLKLGVQRCLEQRPPAQDTYPPDNAKAAAGGDGTLP